MLTLEKQQPPTNQYRSIFTILFIILNSCLSSFFFGYSIVYLSTISFSTIANIYSFQESSILQGVVNGCIPIGAGVGALLSSILLNNFSRRNFFLVSNLLAAVSLAIIQIPYLPSLIIGRFIQGICTGFYSAIVPLYINEIVPPSLSRMGAINQASIALAQSLAYLIAYLLSFTLSPNGQWLFLSLFLYATLAIQTIIFIFIFPYDTPKYLFDNNLSPKAIQLIKVIYSDQHVSNAIKRYQTSNSQPQQSQLREDDLLEQKMIPITTKLQPKSNSWLPIFIAVQISLLQQLVGVNAVVTYGVNIFKTVLPSYQQIIPIIITAQPAICATATSFILMKVGRKFLLQMGTIASVVTLCMCFVGFLIGSDQLGPQILIISALIIYMAFFGLSLGPVVWLYIPQIVEPRIIPFSTMTNWIGASFCIILFPIIEQDVLNGNPAYLFLFFMVCSGVGLVINFFWLVETKDKTRQQINLEYQQISCIS